MTASPIPQPFDGPKDENTLRALASLNLNLLVPLLALLEERSVTQAAQRVGLSQPAMSHALKKIRRLIGDELLVRQSTGMELTPRAVEMITPLKQALHQAASLVGTAGFEPATDSRTVTLAMTTSTGFVLGARIATLLRDRAPNMTLKIKTSNMSSPTVFTDDGVDAALITETLHSPYPRERLFDDRWVVIASKEIPETDDVLALLNTEAHIVFEDPPRRVRPYVALEEAGSAYQVSIRANDYLMIPHLVSRTRATSLHRFQAMEEFKTGLPIRVYDFPLPIHNIGVDLVWNPWLGEDSYKAWLKQILLDAAEPLQARYQNHS